MTLTIRSEEDEQRQLKMTVEVPEDRVDKGMRQAARRLAKEIHVPGFRPGKAPYQVVLRRVGRDALRREVVEEMLQPVLEEAVDQLEIELSAPPSLDNMELEPLVFEFTVPLTPQVQLGDYRAIRKEIEPVTISEDAVAEAMEQVRVRHQIVEEVERPSELGDLITVSGRGEWRREAVETSEEASGDEAAEAPDAATLEQSVDDPVAETAEAEDVSDIQAEEAAVSQETEGLLFEEESIDFLLDPEKLFKGTPFVEHLVGLGSGDEKSFSINFPDDFEDDDLAGAEATFQITVLNVKSRQLPELDDELAKQEGEFEDLNALRQAKREQLEEEATRQAKGELIETMITDMLADTTMVYPPASVEQEIDNMVESFKQQISRAGWNWEDYLKLQGNAEATLRQEFRPQATDALKRRLVLRQFVLEEKLGVKEADLDAAIEERVARFGDNESFVASMKEYYRSGYGFDMISSEILMDKVHERIEAIVSGSAPDLAALEEESQESTEEEE